MQQSPAAVDAGAFHNDVVAVANCNVLLYHEAAFHGWRETEEAIVKASDYSIHFIKASESDITLFEAVSTYLFNSQLIRIPGGGMMILAPFECQNSESARIFLERIASDASNPIFRIEYVNLHRSMRNGGGPACPRLRVVLDELQFESVVGDSRVILDQGLYSELTAWIEKHYRERVFPNDLGDPVLLRESHTSLDELTGIISLGPIYDFQKA